MKISHINNILVQDKHLGFEVLRQFEKYNILHIQKEAICPAVKDGFGLCLCYGYTYNLHTELNTLKDNLYKKFNINIALNNYRLPYFPQTGAFVHDFKQNIVYIPFDIFSPLGALEKEQRMEYIKYIFDEYIGVIFKSLKIMTPEEQEQEAFVRFFTQKIEYRQIKIESEISGLNNEILSYQRAIVERYQKIKVLNNGLLKSDEMHNIDKEKIKSEINIIKTLSFVKNVEILADAKITINVGDIYIKDIYIGEFLIHIHPNKIDFTNLNNEYIYTPSGTIYYHPHIKRYAICFGNRQTLIYKLLAQNELSKLVFFCYQFLKSYNSRDNFISLDNWKYKQLEKQKKEKEEQLKKEKQTILTSSQQI